MEPPLEARPRQSVELADALEPQPLQQSHDLRRKAQGFDGEGRERGLNLSVGNDEGRFVRVAGKRMRPAQGLGQGKPRGETCAHKPPRHVGKKRSLAAEEMGDAGDFEPEPVIAVGIEGGGIAARGPAGEVEKGIFILLGRGRKGEKTRTDGAGIGEAEAGEETFADACRIDRRESEPAFRVAYKGQRPVID